MSPAKHTPGPWYDDTKGDDQYQSIVASESTGHTVAITFTANDADARLIAAAPDLLSACQAAVEYLREYNDRQNDLDRCEIELVWKLDDAIRNATGC